MPRRSQRDLSLQHERDADGHARRQLDITGWTGDSPAPGHASFAMNQPRTVTAQFVPIGTPPTITRPQSCPRQHPGRHRRRPDRPELCDRHDGSRRCPDGSGAAGRHDPAVVRDACGDRGRSPDDHRPDPSGQATTLFEYTAPTYETHEGWRRPAFAIDRYVAFETGLPLLPDDTNGVSDIYVHDDVTDTLHRVSVSTVGREAIGGESRMPRSAPRAASSPSSRWPPTWSTVIPTVCRTSSSTTATRTRTASSTSWAASAPSGSASRRPASRRSAEAAPPRPSAATVGSWPSSRRPPTS